MSQTLETINQRQLEHPKLPGRRLRFRLSVSHARFAQDAKTQRIQGRETDSLPHSFALYFDPHVKHDTGEQNGLKGW